jgi:hypothetical protein
MGELLREITVVLNKQEGWRRLQALKAELGLDCKKNKEVLAQAYRLYKYMQRQLGKLYVRHPEKGMILFEMPEAPETPSRWGKKLRLGFPPHLTDRLEKMVEIDQGSVHSVTERALLVLEMAIDGLQVYKRVGGVYVPEILIRRVSQVNPLY